LEIVLNKQIPQCVEIETKAGNGILSDDIRAPKIACFLSGIFGWD
jgi:hypothetical protein